MVHNLFPNDVYLEPIKHQYFDASGNRYMSFSALYGKLVKKFDADKISRIIAINSDYSADEIKGHWNKATENGSRVDKALEMFAQVAMLSAEDEDLRPLVTTVLKKYKDYPRCYEQGVPYSKEYRVAGSWDKLSLTSTRKDSKFIVSDFKCFEKGFDSLFVVKGQPWLNAPFSHLPNNKYTKISFQLSFYAYLFEMLTGRKCERLFIDLIVPKWNTDNTLESFENMIVPVNYLQNDVKILLDTYKNEIIAELDMVVDIDNEPY